MMAINHNLIEASYYEVLDDSEVRCLLCPFRCRIVDGKRGVCFVRENRHGVLYGLTYGKVAATAIDPIEKKPLYHFLPGRQVFSIGGWGCNLKCQFCQNSQISQFEVPTRLLSPREVAKSSRENGSIGVAYTYNEPLIAFEYVFDCARAVRNAGGKNILVTNGYINPGPLEELLPYIDAMNIDIKAFNENFYHSLCRATLEPVLETVKTAVKKTHVELTTLLIPNTNDAAPELVDLAKWIQSACGRSTPAHLTAYFPSYHLRQQATTFANLQHAHKIFKEYLDHVYIGNVATLDAGNTYCASCGEVVIKRHAFSADLSGMKPDGTCTNCGAKNNIIAA